MHQMQDIYKPMALLTKLTKHLLYNCQFQWMWCVNKNQTQIKGDVFSPFPPGLNYKSNYNLYTLKC